MIHRFSLLSNKLQSNSRTVTVHDELTSVRAEYLHIGLSVLNFVGRIWNGTSDTVRQWLVPSVDAAAVGLFDLFAFRLDRSVCSVNKEAGFANGFGPSVDVIVDDVHCIGRHVQILGAFQFTRTKYKVKL